MKKIVALCLLAVLAPTLIGCEAKAKVNTDDGVKVKASVDKD